MVVARVDGPPPDLNSKIKPISEVIDETPLMGEREFKMARWISVYYFSSLGEALGTFLPFSRLRPSKRVSKGIAKRETSSPEERKEAICLNEEQEKAFRSVMDKEGQDVFLLSGVTGSGKTHVYLRLIEEYLKADRQVLVLLPEIALTPQVRAAFVSHFSEQLLAIVHSKVAPQKKIAIWEAFKQDRLKILVGTRSVIFAPAHRLGLVIIDEEHETTYKNNSTPRYHARHVAQMRCRQSGAKLLLGSATPSLETYSQALRGRIGFLQLKRRFYGTHLPRSSFIHPSGASDHLLDDAISSRLSRIIEEGKQAIIYINRRGYAPAVKCRDCGYVSRCHQCDIPFTYHRHKRRLMCHYCNSSKIFDIACTQCRSKHLGYFGVGIEKIEEELKERFAGIRLFRADSDTLTTENKSADLFSKFARGEGDVLVGTQILTKGHDFSRVAAVFIIAPEMTLAFPDFRSAERVCAQITQVSGRAGRREERGEVYIQTGRDPHPAIEAGKNLDHLRFLEQELNHRRLFHYPPYVRILRLVFRSRSEKSLETTISRAAETLGQKLGSEVEMLGPSPCILRKVKMYYRWNLIFKIRRLREFQAVIRRFRSQFKSPPSIYIEYDMDPVELI